MLGAKKRFTSSFHPQTNGCVERLNHTVCQMLSHVVGAQQLDWDEYLLQVCYCHNNHVSKATGLAATEIHIGRYPRLPMTLLGSRNDIKGWQSTARDQLDYLHLMKARQTRTYELVKENDRLMKAKHRANHEKIDNAFRTTFAAGQWVWVYDVQHTLSTANGIPSLDREAVQQRIKAKLANKWVGPFKILGVGPCAVDEHEIGPNLLYLDLPKDSRTNRRVSV